MTTPERLRRRQRFIELVLVPAVILLSCGTVIYNNEQNERQDECQASAFRDLSEVLTVRGELAERDSLNVNRVIATAANATSPEPLREAFRDYETERQAITKARDENPIPPFPTGKCD